MESEQYRVVLSGELVAERTEHEVAEALAKLFKQPKELILQLFSGSPYPIKQVFPKAQARKLREHILAAGAECYLEAVGVPSKARFHSDDVSSAPAQTPARSAANQVRCPKCGAVQATGDSCAECGIVYSKYQAQANREAATEQEAEPMSHSREWYLFVGPKADYYIERFEQFRSAGGYLFRWNWAGFFIPFYWALYRKMWMWAVLILGVSFVPLLNLVAWIGLAGSVNYIYYRHVQAECDYLRKRHTGEGLEQRLAERGGTSPLAAWGAFALTVLMIYASVITMQSGIEQVMEQQQVESIAHGESLPDEVLAKPQGMESFGRMNALYLTTMVVAARQGKGAIEGFDLDGIAAAARLDEAVLYDGWDQRFELAVNDGRVRIISAGPDGYFGSEDDLVMDREL